MPIWPFVSSNVWFSCYFLNLFSNGFSYLFSFITDISLAVIHIKRRISIWPILIHPFIEPLIGHIVPIMDSGNYIIKLKFAFHKKVVLTFAIDFAAVNDWKRFKGVFDYWIDIRLWCMSIFLFDLVWLCFWFVVFCLGKVANHHFVLLLMKNTLLFVCFLSLFIIYNFIHLLLFSRH